MNPNIRESHISATTPLFSDEKNPVFFVSPTESLSFARRSAVMEEEASTTKSSFVHGKSESTDTLSSIGDSFRTAYSVEDNSNSKVSLDTIQSRKVSGEVPQFSGNRGLEKNTVFENEQKIDDSLSFDFNVTPLVKNTTFGQIENDIVTPKAEHFSDKNTSVANGHNSLNNHQSLNNSRNTLSGLGLSKPIEQISNNNSSDNVTLRSNRNSLLRASNGRSPTRAIRTSMILNDQIAIQPGSGTPKQPLPNELENYGTFTSNELNYSEDHASAYTTTASVSNSIELDSDSNLFNNSFETEYMQRTDSEQAKKKSSVNIPDENLAFMFIVATHSFDASTLEDKEDESICLSFKKDDVAFVHTVDESGWGEVTLVKNEVRGWVPFNYFSDIVRSESSLEDKKYDSLELMIETRKPLEQLLTTCAKFLLSPCDELLTYSAELTFNLEYVNAIRDGVKTLLELTECVSRSNELIQASNTLRKSRKKLLADWYNLMIKADHYKHTTSKEKISKLVSLVYEVLKRSFAFYVVWSKEKLKFEETKSKNNKKVVRNSLSESGIRGSNLIHKEMQYLDVPPNATLRLHEIYDILFNYIGIILGRLDIIEHNPNSCETLEYIVLQMIILLRELLYISKSCATIIQQKYQHTYENYLDESLDPLLSLVSILVSCIKQLVTQILSEDYNNELKNVQIKKGTYFYTDEGKHLMMIVSSMAPLISNAISGCSNYIRIIGDFQLGSDREYPDFKNIRITPEQFIRKCSNGLVKGLKGKSFKNSLSKENRIDSDMKEYSRKKISRYSTIRVGNNNSFGISPEGNQFLQDLMPDKPFSRDSIFDKFKLEEADLNNDTDVQLHKDIVNNREEMMEQIMTNNDGEIIGSSFKALVFKLTDEIWKVDDFFISTFLLNFRTFGSTVDLIDLLITRFDVANKSSYNEYSKTYSSNSPKLKLRRKLICKVFQTWMESYWDYETDFDVLATLINFYNEGINTSLPIEAKSLIEVAAKLYVAAGKSSSHYFRTQIKSRAIPRSPGTNKTASVISSASGSSTNARSSLFSVDDKLIEEYELTHVIEPPNQNSFSLPIPILNIGKSSLLSKYNIQDMEAAVKKYRNILDDNLPTLEVKYFQEKNDLEILIKEWNEMVKNQQSISKHIHLPLNLVDLNPLEIAKQLTIIESKLYLSIEPFELVNDNFLENKKHSGLAPNVNLIIDFTNQLSHYVIEGILSPNLSYKTRASRLKGWLKIALSVLYFRNFNSVASIMTALQNHVITRVTDIWDLLDTKDIELFDYLSRIIHPNNNFKVYRKKLSAIMEGDVPGSNKAQKCSLPVVPFFNLFLQDLTFISEGNPNYRNQSSFRPNETINIDKYFKISKSIATIQFFQVPYQTRETTQSSKRESFFSLTEHLDIDTNSITPIPLLQEFILDEFWRVNTLYSSQNDRGYELSLQLKART